ISSVATSRKCRLRGMLFCGHLALRAEVVRRRAAGYCAFWRSEDFFAGEARLERATEVLLGASRQRRRTRIMVTSSKKRRPCARFNHRKDESAWMLKNDRPRCTV